MAATARHALGPSKRSQSDRQRAWSCARSVNSSCRASSTSSDEPRRVRRSEWLVHERRRCCRTHAHARSHTTLLLPLAVVGIVQASSASRRAMWKRQVAHQQQLSVRLASQTCNRALPCLSHSRARVCPLQYEMLTTRSWIDAADGRPSRRLEWQRRAHLAAERRADPRHVRFVRWALLRAARRQHAQLTKKLSVALSGCHARADRSCTRSDASRTSSAKRTASCAKVRARRATRSRATAEAASRSTQSSP